MATAESGPKLDLDESLVMQYQLTDEEKKGNLGRIISYILSAVQADCSIYKVYDDVMAMNKMKDHVLKVENLLDNLVEKFDCEEVMVKEFEEWQAQNRTAEVFGNFDCPVIELTKLDTAGDVSAPEKIKTQIINRFKSHQQQASDDMVKNITKADSVVAAIQMVKIYFAWKAISAASNVIEDKDKFTQIKKNLQKMESMVMELVEICETQPGDKSIPRKTAKICTLFQSTTAKISDITVKINGLMQRLDLISDYAVVDALFHTATALTRAYQLWSVFQNLSSPTKLLGALSVAMYGMFGVANGTIFMISKEKLQELRKDLKEAIVLKETLNELFEQAEDCL